MKKTFLFIFLYSIFNSGVVFASFIYPLTIFSEENGGIEHNINCVLQDKRGFLWVSTNNGLCRYDGKNFKIYQNNPANINSISSNRILNIAQQDDSNLWVSLEKKGFARYNYMTDNFTNFEIDENSSTTLQPNNICNFTIIDKKVLWAVTPTNIYKITIPNENQSDKLIIEQTIPFYVPNLSSYNCKIVTTNKNFLMISTPVGLYTLTSKNGGNFTIKKAQSLDGYSIKSILCDKRQLIWVLTNKGIFTTKDGENFNINQFPISLKNADVSLIQSRNGNYIINIGDRLYSWKEDGFKDINVLQVYDKTFLEKNRVNYLYADNTNTLWIGTSNRGLGKIDLEANAFNLLELIDPQSGEQMHDIVRDLMIDSRQYLWISTKTTGLIVYDLSKKKSPLFFKQNKSRLIHSSFITSTFEDSHKRIWVCTNDGLFLLEGDPFSGKLSVVNITLLPDYPKEMKTNVNSVVEDNFGRFWVTSFNGYVCISNFDKQPNFKFFPQVQQVLKAYKDKYFNQIHLFSWSNGMQTLFITNNIKDVVSQSIFSGVEYNSLSNNHIWNVTRTTDSTFWIGTDVGLFCTIRNSKNLKRISQIGEFQNPRVQAITEDKNNNLWLNTTGGLICWNRKSETAIKYDVSDGLSQNSFNEAVCKDANGNIYVAGNRGINYFNPDFIKVNRYLPQVIINQISISNKHIEVGDTLNGRVLLSSSIFLLNEIKLKYFENNITLEFSNLHFNNISKNKCAYKLEGYDKEWIIAQPEQRFATYNSLPDGKYTFLVKGSNNDGLWNETPATLIIKIGAAPWNSIWAYIIYLSIIGWLVYRYYVYLQLRKKLLIENLERKKEVEINESKMHFFTEITHELRAPLMLIVAPVLELLTQNDLNQFTRQRLKVVKNSSERLLKLVNKYLDLDKMNANEYPLYFRKRELVNDLLEIKESFNTHSIQKKIHYEFQCEFNKLDAWYDKEKIEIVLVNLLSNAFKFTPENGEIYFFVEMIDEQNVCITIQDSGCGISSTDLEKIFMPFYQVGQFRSVGTGIGLTLTKKLIELHHGKIEVSSTKAVGSKFSIIFPINRSAYPESAIIDDENAELMTEDQASVPEMITSDLKDYKILIVEDDIDLQNYMKMILEPHYHILTAGDGKEGKKLAFQHIPDLILMDINLPKMNGMELTGILKKDVKTQHIPILVITGNEGQLIEQEAYEKGVHDWIQKPFVANILSMKVANILKSRQLLSKNEIKTRIKNQQSEGEKEFLHQLIAIVEKNIENSYFGVDQLAESLKMTRMQLHRKLNATVGKSSSEIIKEIRLNKSKELLASGKYNISEVYYHVGFSSHSYFTKVFKEHFGILPSEIKW